MNEWINEWKNIPVRHRQLFDKSLVIFKSYIHRIYLSSKRVEQTGGKTVNKSKWKQEVEFQFVLSLTERLSWNGSQGWPRLTPTPKAETTTQEKMSIPWASTIAQGSIPCFYTMATCSVFPQMCPSLANPAQWFSLGRHPSAWSTGRQEYLEYSVFGNYFKSSLGRNRHPQIRFQSSEQVEKAEVPWVMDNSREEGGVWLGDSQPVP